MKAKVRPDKGVRNQEREDARYNALRGMGVPALDARVIARVLEYRVVCHEILGGDTKLIIDEVASADKA
jgi:hypothetical protein